MNISTFTAFIVLSVSLTAAGQQSSQAPPQTTTQQVDGRAATACTPATDPEYGTTMQKAIRIGGGGLYMAARERRYLEALRGPEGQEITFQRRGSTRTPELPQPIDIWELNWVGLEKPKVLYLYAYLYGEPQVPKGFTCAGFRLGTPPVDGFMSTELQRDLALEQGSQQEFAPISLDPDGSAKSGIMFDRFRQIARAAKLATDAGKPLTKDTLPPAVARAGLIIVAYPKKCGEQMAAPTRIDVAGRAGAVKPLSGIVPHGDLDKLMPGLTAPEKSAGITFPLDNLRPGDAVRVLYDPEACPGDKGTILPSHVTGNKGRVMPEPPKPDGVEVPSEALWLQAVVDLDGKLRLATRIGGPEAPVFLEQAHKTLLDWQAEPARVNGSPVVSDTLLLFRFLK